MVSQEVGYDSGKKTKGRKRHILVNTLGLLIVVVITAASVSEQAGAKKFWLNSILCAIAWVH